MKNPEILILDDSASALDFATDARLRKAIAENTDQMTVFIVSQRASSIMQADKIIVLDDGKMAGIGTHQELLRTCEVYQEILQFAILKRGGGTSCVNIMERLRESESFCCRICII